MQVTREHLAGQCERTNDHAPPPAGFPRPLQPPDHEGNAGQGVDHAGVHQVRPGVAAQPEEGGTGQCARRRERGVAASRKFPLPVSQIENTVSRLSAFQVSIQG